MRPGGNGCDWSNGMRAIKWTPHPFVKIASSSSQAQPEYTAEARAARIEGAVELLVVIGEDGAPHSVQVQKALGYGLDEKAIECVVRWRFKPGSLSGQACPRCRTFSRELSAGGTGRAIGRHPDPQCTITPFDRHRGGGHPPTPATPPCIRVRTRRFESVTLAVVDQGWKAARLEVGIGESPRREPWTGPDTRGHDR